MLKWAYYSSVWFQTLVGQLDSQDIHKIPFMRQFFLRFKLCTCRRPTVDLVQSTYCRDYWVIKSQLQEIFRYDKKKKSSSHLQRIFFIRTSTNLISANICLSKIATRLFGWLLLSISYESLVSCLPLVNGEWQSHLLFFFFFFKKPVILQKIT